ncbi:MAG TPA: hypothetical protein VFG73_02220 [Rhodanobacteraceae bacterium]|nr:hypothetical protein [Rhodanobacteraceae bacterium]
MSKYSNPALRAAITAAASGALYIDKQTFNLAADYGPAALANGDVLSFAVVPAGHVLVPHLSTVSIPQLDSNGAATATYTLGTADDADVLKGAQDGGAAVALGAGELLDVTVGSPDEDVPLLLTLTAPAATANVSGAIVANLVFRAYNADIDG